MSALHNDKYEWYTIFTTELGSIELSIIPADDYDEGMVRLSYYDKANSKKVRNAAMDDL